MSFHHLITLELIAFSYINNYYRVNALVLWMHDLTDVFIYFERIVMEVGKANWTILVFFMVNVTMIYTRIYVFAKDVIYIGY